MSTIIGASSCGYGTINEPFQGPLPDEIAIGYLVSNMLNRNSFCVILVSNLFRNDH